MENKKEGFSMESLNMGAPDFQKDISDELIKFLNKKFTHDGKPLNFSLNSNDKDIAIIMEVDCPPVYIEDIEPFNNIERTSLLEVELDFYSNNDIYKNMLQQGLKEQIAAELINFHYPSYVTSNINHVKKTVPIIKSDFIEFTLKLSSKDNNTNNTTEVGNGFE